MKALEFPLVLPDLRSTIVVHGTGQFPAAGCDAELRRKRVPADTVGHRRQQPVELHNVLRARAHGCGESTFREHRKQVNQSPGSPRARGALLHDWRVQTNPSAPRSR